MMKNEKIQNDEKWKNSKFSQRHFRKMKWKMMTNEIKMKNDERKILGGY